MIGLIVETDPNEEAYAAFDLDATLAEYLKEDSGNTPIGHVVIPMYEKIKWYQAHGIKCKLLTARAGFASEVPKIEAWLQYNDQFFPGLAKLEISNVKSHKMLVLYDDRAVQIIPNTGMMVGSEKYIQGYPFN